MNNFKTLAFAIVLVAIVGPLVCVEWTAQAQKTRANSFQQTISSGNNPNSVYGDYGQTSSLSSTSSSFNRRPSSSFAGPVNQQRQRTPVNRPAAFQQQQSSIQSSLSDVQQSEADSEPASYGAVQGSPGTDFPNYARVPKTSFTCKGLPYDYGMYADEETGCQAFHICYNGRKDSFLCGPGTVFNQRILHCDYWYSVDCSKSSQYWSSNAYMGSSQPEPGPAEASASGQSSQVASPSFNRPSKTNFINQRQQQPQQQRQQPTSFSRDTQQVVENY